MPSFIFRLIITTIYRFVVCGKVEVRIGMAESAVFVGIGTLGWRRRFNWYEVKTIREESTSVRYPGGYQGGIMLEGQQRLKFGTNLNEKRRYFVLNTLKYLKAKTL